MGVEGLRFTVGSMSGGARTGVLDTARGPVQTPAFMPVGTQGSVKALTPGDLRSIGAEIVLGNTYHLSLRPGIDVIRRHGGVQEFMRWSGPVLTDSGGFQVFSLGHMRRLTDEGVTFRSHIDGSEHFLSPELAVEYQRSLGSDIAMVLDHCPAYGESDEEVRQATERTSRWAKRCLDASTGDGPALFGIVQGGWSEQLRRSSAEHLASLGFQGYAVGGVSVGEPKALAYQAVEQSVPYLPPDKPRYLMGVGSPEDLVTCIGMGIDLFDCALPTKVARNGGMFTKNGRINIRNAAFAGQLDPVDPEVDCDAAEFSASYLHHLLKSGELLFYRLASLHNLRFVLRLMEQARDAIRGGRYAAFAEGFLSGYRVSNEEARLAQRQKMARARAARASSA